MANNRVYMDWNATAPLLPQARAAMLDVLDMAGNPSSVHREGRAVQAAIQSARRSVAALVGGEPAHVIFTSGATEAANFVLTPTFRMGKAALSVSRLLVAATEHKAVREGGRFAPDQITEIPVTASGLIDMSALGQALDQHDRSTGLVMVALMLANNETGIIQPVAEVSALVHAHGGIMVVDAVQAVGRIAVDINELGADFLLVSSHKIGGPMGAGAVVCRGETMMPKALMRGGGQEKGHRSGTENAAAIVGFGAAAANAATTVPLFAGQVALLRDRLETELRAIAPNVVIHGSKVERITNTTFFSLDGLKAETGHIAFDIEGIAVSAGSACSSGKVGESHVLAAMGLDARHGALRLSIGPQTTLDDILQTTHAFGRIAARLKPAVNAA